MVGKSIFAVSVAILFLLNCSPAKEEVVELRHLPIDRLEGIISLDSVEFDREVTSDGNGSLRVTAAEPTTVRLYEMTDIDIDNARLIYQARIRTEDMDGQAYLEIWCHFAGRGEFYSRGLERPLSGTTDWTTEETPFLLREGENPDRVKLNLVINGSGTAWIDDIHLIAGPLK
jgi:hypothetical protein